MRMKQHYGIKRITNIQILQIFLMTLTCVSLGDYQEVVKQIFQLKKNAVRYCFCL